MENPPLKVKNKIEIPSTREEILKEITQKEEENLALRESTKSLLSEKTSLESIIYTAKEALAKLLKSSFLKKYALRGGLVAGLALGGYKGSEAITNYMGKEKPVEYKERVTPFKNATEQIYIAPATANISALAESMSTPTNSAPTAEALLKAQIEAKYATESAQIIAQNTALKAQIEAMEKAKAKADARPNLNNDDDFFDYFSRVPRPPMTGDDVIRWNNGLPGRIRGNR